jgi:hypothetical protein
MLLSKRIHFILIIIFLIILFGCKEKVTTPETTAFGILSTYDGCKTFTTTSGLGSSPHEVNEECIEYEYDGERLLVLKHINSGFNCCPGKITADISVSGNMIAIEEKEQEQGCFCRCLFDIRYEIHELQPGEYTIAIKGLYVEDTDEELRFNVNLYGPCSGAFCVSRTHYPWDTPN